MILVLGFFATLLSRLKGLRQELSIHPQLKPSFVNIPFLVLVAACAQQLVSSTCQFVPKRLIVVVLFVQLREQIKPSISIVLGE